MAIDTHCHCGADMRGSDHCPACGCEQYEADCGRRPYECVPVTDIVASVDIARLFNVLPSAVTNWKNRDVGFPEPFLAIGSGRIALYRKSEVLAWFSERLTDDDLALMREVVATHDGRANGEADHP